MSAPDFDGGARPALPPAGSTEARLARLVAQSRLIREAADEGAAELIEPLLAARRTLIVGLEADTPLPPHCRPLLRELAEEDARTQSALAAWRERVKHALAALPGARNALVGYARPAGPRINRFEREL